MRVSLFVTCLVDQCWPEVGVAAVRVLRRVGCEVVFARGQTCCGQPASNSGFREPARTVARALIRALETEPADLVVTPSGSCAAMVRHLPELFDGDPRWRSRAERLAARTRELSQALVGDLGVEDLGARFEARVAWHDACHGLRDLGVREEPRRLLGAVRGLELVELTRAADCCGFGGTFSVKFPELSVAIADGKLDEIERAGVDAVVSGDASCLMQLGGRLRRRGSSVRVVHLAQVLAGTEA